MISKLIIYTNQKILSRSENYKQQWVAKDTDEKEIKALLGLWYLAGFHKSSRLNLDDLWAADGTGIEIFRTTMSLVRFRFLLCCLRFDDVQTHANNKKIDKIALIREFFDQFVANCKANFLPGPKVTLDEKLEAFRGRCSFRQYIPNKPSKYGIKIFALVDSEVLYILNLEIYCGKQPDGPYNVSNSPLDLVQRMITPVSGSNRNLMIDNWFSSYDLALNLLKKHKITVVGTLRKNKREIPPNFMNTKKNPREQVYLDSKKMLL